ALDLLDESPHLTRQALGRDEQPDLHDRRRQRGDGDDAEEHDRPGVHAVSPLRACWKASRPRSIALVRFSRPSLTAWRPRSVALAARSRPSRAFSLSNSRVSSPVAGAYNRAPAPPATAPTRNARTTLPAPAPSSRAIVHLRTVN